MDNLLKCVQETISDIHGIPFRLLWLSKGRTRDVAFSRHTGIYVYYVASGKSMSEVGDELKMHRTSILHAIRRCDLLASRDSFYEMELRNLVDFCIAKEKKICPVRY